MRPVLSLSLFATRNHDRAKEKKSAVSRARTLRLELLVFSFVPVRVVTVLQTTETNLLASRAEMMSSM